MAHRAFCPVPAQAIVAQVAESFKEFPPRAKAASFTVERRDGQDLPWARKRLPERDCHGGRIEPASAALVSIAADGGVRI